MRNARTRIKPLIALGAATLALTMPLTGCSVPGSSTTKPAPDPGITDTPPVAPEELHKPRASPWDKHQIVDDTHIRVWYEGGGGPCYDWSAEVTETEDRITITVLGGWLKEELDSPCEMPGTGSTTKSMTIETEHPVNDRDVRDGSHEYTISNNPSSDTATSEAEPSTTQNGDTTPPENEDTTIVDLD